jgi:hypothetical protein
MVLERPKVVQRPYGNTKRVALRENNSKGFMAKPQNLDVAPIEDNDGDSREEIIANLRQGFIELELYKQGKLQARPVADFLNEL